MLIMDFLYVCCNEKEAEKKSQTDIIYYIAIEKRSWK